MESSKSGTGNRRNEKLYAKISINARKLVEEKFAWEKIAQQLESVYESAIS